ncbi:19176_t:CDS:2 [Cetraspora pellucida]|uniref:19176_t:CDS:1 n=1 Tax=Cetraspora pellucida TaxID=1433469 RepID=A0A9N9PCR8_9GLOM|nr:19176_t:CDS:2 [Cetraspora pellucida]
MTDKARLANPNAIINTKYNNAHLFLGDGKKVHIRTGNKTIEHVLTIVNKHTRKLQEDEEFAA